MLVTSRWSGVGPAGLTRCGFEVLPRMESVAFLRRRTGAADQRRWTRWRSWWGICRWRWRRPPPTWRKPRTPADYLELVRDRARELFGLDRPDGGGDSGRTIGGWPPCGRSRWTGSSRGTGRGGAAEPVRVPGPGVPRGLPTEHPEVLPAELASVVRDRLALQPDPGGHRPVLAGHRQPDSVGLHRLVQAVIQARLPGEEERSWTGAAVRLLREAFPADTLR